MKILSQKSAIRIVSLIALCALAACGGRGAAPSRPSAKTGEGGYYKVGKPYQIKGEWYEPKEDYSYDETGIASWYGADFHEEMTANGETYNKNELTAAHKTLPMPSLARVTNLENGRAIVVRINDRGPFSGARIIDVSQRAAQLLGFEKAGTAKVRVQVLADESRAIAEAMRTYGGPSKQTDTLYADALSANNRPITAAQNAPVEVAQLEPPKSFATPAVQSAPLPTSVRDVHPVPQYVQMPVSGPNLIYIQAGAFTNPDNANKLKTKLQKVGQTSVAQALVKGVQYYRVRVGPINTVDQADKLLKVVLKSGADNARIIVD